MTSFGATPLRKLRNFAAVLLAAGVLYIGPHSTVFGTPLLAQEPSPTEETLDGFRSQKIILVGDSTMQNLSGWGGSFCAERVIPFVSCLNLGRGGRSTKTYIAEGAWNLALNEMRVPGYRRVWVLLQFGHNDQGAHARSTDLASEYPANLRKYVTEARDAGATPILVTPVTRRTFSAGALTRDLDPWAATVRSVGEEMGVPVIDLNRRSADLVRAMGPVMATHFAETSPSSDTLMAAIGGVSVSEKKPEPTPKDQANSPAPERPSGPALPALRGSFDYTHLGAFGAELTAMLVAAELASEVPDMRPVLRP